jgi:hypothetical protein
MSYQYCGLHGFQWAHHAFVVLFITSIVLEDVPVKNQSQVDCGHQTASDLNLLATGTVLNSGLGVRRFQAEESTTH